MYEDNDLRRLRDEFQSLPSDPLVLRSESLDLGELAGCAPVVVALAAVHVENGPWHVSADPDTRQDFLLLAETGARIAGYTGQSPVSYWLDFTCRNGAVNVRKTCSQACQRLLNDWHRRQTTRASQNQGSLSVIPDNIKFLRGECGWSQEGLAEEANIAKRRIQEHETGKKIPSPRHCKRYVATFSRALSRNISVYSFKNVELKAHH